MNVSQIFTPFSIHGISEIWEAAHEVPTGESCKRKGPLALRSGSLEIPGPARMLLGAITTKVETTGYRSLCG